MPTLNGLNAFANALTLTCVISCERLLPGVGAGVGACVGGQVGGGGAAVGGGWVGGEGGGDPPHVTWDSKLQQAQEASKRVPGPQVMGAEGPPARHCTKVLHVGSAGLGTSAPLVCPEQMPVDAGGEGGGGVGGGGRREGGRLKQPLVACMANTNMNKDSLQLSHIILGLNINHY